MRLRIAWVAIGLALAGLLAAVPGVEGQTTGPTPDPAQIALGQSDAEGWTQTQGVRSEGWGAPATDAPNSPSQMYAFETVFSRQLADGSHQTLTSRATEGSADLRTAHFQAVQHDALGQTPIQVPSGAVGYWENAGDSRSGAAAAQVGSVLLEVQVSGVTPAQPVADDQVASWLSTMMTRASSSPDAPPQDWSQVLPGQPAAWPLLLDQAGAGDNWDQQTGLDLSSQELHGSATSVRAVREFSHTGPYRRTLTSAATVFDSAADATAQGMTAPGKAIDAPALGDEATAFKAMEGADNDATEVTYTVNVRHGPVVITTQETGVVDSLDSPDETFALATTADARATSALTQ
jgi:hypothetical protein